MDRAEEQVKGHRRQQEEHGRHQVDQEACLKQRGRGADVVGGARRVARLDDAGAHGGNVLATMAPLVANGLSNKQIAARLLISEHTVDSHVRNILDKLGVNTRAQIAAWMASSMQTIVGINGPSGMYSGR